MAEEEIKEQNTEIKDEETIVKDAKLEGKAGGKDDGNEEEKDEELLEEDKAESYKVDKETFALISLLRSPETRGAVIAALAADAGLAVSKGETPKQAVKTVVEELEEALGDEWSFLAKKIGPVLEKRLNTDRQQIQAEFQEQAKKNIEQESEKATNEFFKDNPDAKKLEQRMVKLMDKYPPSEKVTPYEYLEGIYAIAANSGKGRTATKLAEKAQERVERNSKDAKVEGLSNDEQIRQGSTKMTLRESVTAAAKQHGFIK